MNKNTEIEKIAKELYLEYKSSFDLVYKYTINNQPSSVPNNLLELINEQKDIVPFKSKGMYARFQPQFLYDNIDKLKAQGLLNKEDTLTGSWLFLFEFHITKTSINFDFKIGNYSDTDCRQKVFELFKKNKNLFENNPININKLTSKWQTIFQRKIITSENYNYLSFDDTSELHEEIEKGFNEVITTDLPIILKIIESSFKS